jgi:hypothetical protein
VWFSAPAKTRLEHEYLNAEMPSPGYLWAAGYINVDCSPTHLEWTDVGQARGYYVATHWSEDGRQYRKVHELSMVDGVLEALTSWNIQVLDDDLFWSTIEGIAIGDGGFRVLGVFSERRADSMLFAGVPARVRFLCAGGDCAQCNLQPYVAQFRQLPWQFETSSREEASGVDPSSWFQKCGGALQEHDAHLIRKAENVSLVEVRTDIRPVAMYSSKDVCLRDARPPNPKDIKIAPFPPFSEVRAIRQTGTPRGSLMVSEEKHLLQEQIAALVTLFTEKESFSGAWPAEDGIYDYVDFRLSKSNGKAREVNSVTVSSDCSKAAQSYQKDQGLSELGIARCRRLLDLLGPFKLRRDSAD